MAELVYSAGLTSKLFWLQESRKTAGYILDGYSKADIRKIAWEENIYQVKAEYRAYEVFTGYLTVVSRMDLRHLFICIAMMQTRSAK